MVSLCCFVLMPSPRLKLSLNTHHQTEYLYSELKEKDGQEVAVWYNDNVIYPNKVRLNCYYYRHYSFIKDIEMIFATVLGKKIVYNGEMI